MTRQEAIEILASFQQFLRPGSSKRSPLSPQRALAYLEDTDVAELLGAEACDKVRRAAEVLQ